MHVYLVTNHDYGGGMLGAVFSSVETAEKHASDIYDMRKKCSAFNNNKFDYENVKNIYRIIRVKVDDASILDTVKILKGGQYD